MKFPYMNFNSFARFVINCTNKSSLLIQIAICSSALNDVNVIIIAIYNYITG